MVAMDTHSKLFRKHPFTQTYEVGEVLGSGAFGEVRKGKNKKTGESVAIKMINKKRFKTEQDLKSAVYEVEVLQDLVHPGLVGFRDAYESSTKLYIVMEIVTGGELFEKICEQNEFMEQSVKSCMKAQLEALAYMHECHVTHRDVKPENILLTDSDDLSSIKLTDFGLSKVFHKGEEEVMNETVGTMSYFAPEIIRGQAYNSEVDVWACGVVFFILVAGYHPFDYETEDGATMTNRQIFTNILTFNSQNDLPEHLSAEGKDLLGSMLQVDPAARITARAALKHPWFEGEVGADTAQPMPDHVIKKLRKFQRRRNLRAGMKAVFAMEAFSDLAKHAATTIQRHARGHLDRVRMRRLGEEAVQIQRIVRGRLLRNGLLSPLAFMTQWQLNEVMRLYTLFRPTNQMQLKEEDFCRVFKLTPETASPAFGVLSGRAAALKAKANAAAGAGPAAACSLPDAVDAFAAFAAANLLCRAKLRPKLRFIFCVFDFNGDHSISIDELTILVATCERVLHRITGVQPPAITYIERVTRNAFHRTNIVEKGGRIGMDEFVDWAVNHKEVGEYLKRLRKKNML